MKLLKAIKEFFSNNKIAIFWKNKVQKNKILYPITRILGALMLLGIAGLIGALLAINNAIGNQDDYAQTYFEYFQTHSSMSQYECLDIATTEFTNYDEYALYIEQQYPEGVITDYDIEQIEADNGEYTYKATYTTDSDEKGEYVFVVKEQEEKQYVLFDTYKVILRDEIAKRHTISVPADVEFTFDNKNVSSYEIKSDNEEHKKYLIPYLFKGTHTYEFSSDYIDKTVKTFEVTEDNSEYSIEITGLAMKNEEYTKVKNQTISIITNALTKAMTDGDFTDVLTLFKSDENVQTEVSKVLEELKTAVGNTDGEFLKSLNIKAYENSLDEYTYIKSALMTFNYVCEYDAETGITTEHGYSVEYSGEADSTASVAFEFVDGIWIPVKLNLECFDFSKPE